MNRLIGIVALLFLLSLPSAGAAKDNTKYSSPSSSFEPSSDVKYYASTGSSTVEHTNVTVDDTTDNNAVEVQERSEFNTKTTVTVLNNMGSSAKIYTSDDLESKTGRPVEKEGVVEIGADETARYTTSGTKLIKKKYLSDAEEIEEAADSSEESTRPRVLVS